MFADVAHKKWVHKLGNLALLPKSLNSKLRNQDFDMKKRCLEGRARKNVSSSIENLLPLTQDAFREGDGTKQEIEKHTERRKQKACQLFQL